MPVPPFQKMMLPFLQHCADGNEHAASEMFDFLGKHFALSDADLSERLPSGTQTRFANRVYWARVYLGKAALLETTGRGRFRITQRGQELLATKPSTIDLKLLSQYPEYRAFQEQTGVPQKESEPQVSSDTATPEELIEVGYKDLRSALAVSLLEKIMTGTPKFFEQVVVDLLIAMGYGGSRQDAGRAVGQTGDEGIDGIIKEDRLGLDFVYIQAKRWEQTVGRPQVQGFVGALAGKGATKGVMITTSKFSSDANAYVKTIPQKVVLIDGEQLSSLMIDFNIGVVGIASYEIKKIDLDYFETE
jgi:restriction system protein